MSQRLQIVALQPHLRWQQHMPNMFDLRQTVEQLPQDTDILLLPEGWCGIPAQQWSTELREQATQFLQNLARSARVNVVGGTIEMRDDRGVVRLATPVIHRDGHLAGHYAKRTLFGGEQDIYAAGDRAGVFQLDGWRVGVAVCADLWRSELALELQGNIDILCVPAKTSVPSDTHVNYARQLWHALALTRSMECGFVVAVSDWATARHTPQDADISPGSVHAPGTNYDRGVLYKRHRERDAAPTACGPVVPTATPHTTAGPALGAGVHYTCGAATICNPGHRPEIKQVQRTLERGSPGLIYERIDLDALQEFRDYRKSVGLLTQD